MDLEDVERKMDAAFDLLNEGDAEEALALGLELARRFEPAAVRETLRVEERETLEPCPDEPKGVYAAYDYSFFPGSELNDSDDS